MQIASTIILTYVLFILPVQVIYHFAWGRDHFLFARRIPVEANGEVYMVETKCRNINDFRLELHTKHIGNDLPIPGPEGYRVNGERV